LVVSQVERLLLGGGGGRVEDSTDAAGDARGTDGDCVVPDGDEVGRGVVGDEEDSAEGGEGGLGGEKAGENGRQRWRKAGGEESASR
jgi:hypothetical protein